MEEIDWNTKISSAFNKIAGLAGEKHWRECEMQDKEVHFIWSLKGNSMIF